MYFLIVENKKTNKVSIEGNCKNYGELSYTIDDYLKIYDYVLIDNVNEIDNIGYYLLKNDNNSYKLLNSVQNGIIFNSYYWTVEQVLTVQNYKRKKADPIKLTYAEVVQEIKEKKLIEDL